MALRENACPRGGSSCPAAPLSDSMQSPLLECGEQGRGVLEAPNLQHIVRFSGLLVAELNYGQSVHGAMAHASSADRSRSRPCFFRALFDRGETDGVCTEDHVCTLRIVLRLLPHSSSTRNAAGVATAGRIILTCDDRPRHELLGRPECLSSRVGLCVA